MPFGAEKVASDCVQGTFRNSKGFYGLETSGFFNGVA
jgi:hypothetical protein